MQVADEPPADEAASAYDTIIANAKKYNSPERDKELEGLRALIKEEIAAGFYNIDIDTSTLVDLDKPTLDEQQEVNVTLAAENVASNTASRRTTTGASVCQCVRDGKEARTMRACRRVTRQVRRSTS